MANSPARSVVDVGTVVDGTYTIEALIGRGGMGEVFLASHGRLQGKRVAIKMLHADLGSDEIVMRFKREADIASQLDHPSIVKVEDYNQLPDGTPYIVYEYLQGESLAQRLKAGPLEIEPTLSIMRQVGSALTAAHRAGIVHRDLKPQNIFLCPSEVDGRPTELAKILDFGISKMRGSQTVKTQDSALLGTPQYMAPEQATGQHSSVDERTDIFALGAIVYEMVSGTPAFSGASIPEVVFKVVYEQPVPLATLVPTVPAELASAVGKAMSKTAADRFATVPEFVEALTGSPLTSGIRRPRTAPERKTATQEAFAQTMGSGDHGESPVPTVDAPPPVRGSAPTVDSQSQPVPQPAPAPPPARRRWLVPALAVAAIAIGGGAIYVASRDRGGHEPAHERIAEHEHASRVEHDRPVAHHEAPPPARPPEPPPAPPPPAAPATEIKDTRPVATKAHATLAPAETDVQEDEPSARKLQDAETALRDKVYDHAEQLANSVISSQSSSPRQKLHAHTLRGIVACIAHNSEENAMIEYRIVKDAPKLRRRLVSACHAEGHLISQPD